MRFLQFYSTVDYFVGGVIAVTRIRRSDKIIRSERNVNMVHNVVTTDPKAKIFTMKGLHGSGYLPKGYIMLLKRSIYLSFGNIRFIS